MIDQLTKDLYRASVSARHRGYIEKFRPLKNGWEIVNNHFVFKFSREEALNWIEEKVNND